VSLLLTKVVLDPLFISNHKKIILLPPLSSFRMHNTGKKNFLLSPLDLGKRCKLPQWGPGGALEVKAFLGFT